VDKANLLRWRLILGESADSANAAAGIGLGTEELAMEREALTRERLLSFGVLEYELDK